MKYLYILFVFVIAGCSSSAPENLSVDMPCPPSPNCVSTLSKNETHSIKPYTLHKNFEWEEFINIIRQQPRVKIINQTGNTLHTTFTTKLLRFKDDVIFQQNGSVINFRSSSRMGYSDLGTNRNRMEALRNMLQKNKIIQVIDK